MDLTKLLLLLQAAPDGNDDLDDAIQRALGRARKPVPPYTRSLDAAMTLLPEGWAIHRLGQRGNGGGWLADIYRPSEAVIAFLDETDSGLDIDALRVVAKGVRTVRGEHPEMGVVVVTHYVKLLEEIEPDQVHILVDGQIVHSGDAQLAQLIELEGYDAWRPVSP